MMIKQGSLTIAAILLLGYVGPSQQETPCDKPYHVQEWTQWFDRDNPSGSGDWEDLRSLRKENPGKICRDPRDIEAVTLSGLSVSQTGDNIYRNDLKTGFVCRNEDQRGRECNDYKVRFSCGAKSCDNVCWTKWYNRDSPSGSGDWEDLSALIRENPGGSLCSKPKYIEAVTVDGEIPAIRTGESFHAYSPTKGLICRNKDQNTGRCSNYKVRFGCYCRSVSS
ncbi:cartilage intermediate layer protein 2-like [Fundulus heteroclitus]|uniref:cartilage intermediate layer protein 2-like n=1 Tax=Fundulus heteroclitus TaxID=8078 RepID=UPI00165C34DC|nr:cartilage intermediate layer protein 2-like [Fundulus heteroclitus]